MHKHFNHMLLKLKIREVLFAQYLFFLHQRSSPNLSPKDLKVKNLLDVIIYLDILLELLVQLHCTNRMLFILFDFYCINQFSNVEKNSPY